jgi:hypothetical protein
LEHLLQFEETHWVALRVDHEHRVLDQVDPQLIDLEMTHDILTDRVDVFLLIDYQLVVLIEVTLREHDLRELSEVVPRGIQSKHMVRVGEVLHPSLALVNILRQPSTELLAFFEDLDVIVIK